MAFYVSRQRDNESNRLFIEIACGGSKTAGKDMLTKRYDGEEKNLVSPKDAVMVAERIFKKWDQDYADETKALRIVAHSGTTTEPLEFPFDAAGLKKANEWADKTLAHLDICGACSKPMGNRAAFETEHIANKVFCSEVCVSKKYRDMYQQELPGSVSGAKKSKKTTF